MELASSLRQLLTQTFSIEQKQKSLIDLVLGTYDSYERSILFQSITNYRKEQLASLFPENQNRSYSVLFELMDYRDLIQHYPNTLSAEVALLEAVVGQCYLHWLDFWCECEIAAIKAKYPLEENAPTALQLPFEDSAYDGVLIERVEDAQLMVQTPNHPQAMALSDAIALSNLELFILGEKWFEMLPLLFLSKEGKHFIVLTRTFPQSCPTLVASALIQDWASHDTWLSYAPQFSNEQWRYCFPTYGAVELTRLQLFKSSVLSQCHSLPEFDDEFKLQLSDVDAVCEVLRLTVSGNTQQKLYFLYLAQKELMSVLHQSGYKIGFTIIEQPFMLNFYQVIDKKAYFHSGGCDLNNDGKETFRGFWNFERMVNVFDDTNFRDYKRAIRLNRKRDAIDRREHV